MLGPLFVQGNQSGIHSTGKYNLISYIEPFIEHQVNMYEKVVNQLSKNEYFQFIFNKSGLLNNMGNGVSLLKGNKKRQIGKSPDKRLSRFPRCLKKKDLLYIQPLILIFDIQ